MFDSEIKKVQTFAIITVSIPNHFRPFLVEWSLVFPRGDVALNY